MNNQKGFSLLGMLLTAVLLAVLVMVVLKQYSASTAQLLPVPAAPRTDQARPEAPVPEAEECKGRKVGNMCIPTQLESSSLEAFEQLSR